MTAKKLPFEESNEPQTHEPDANRFAWKPEDVVIISPGDHGFDDDASEYMDIPSGAFGFATIAFH